MVNGNMRFRMGEMKDNLFTKEERIITRISDLMAFEPHRWRFHFSSPYDYRLTYRRHFRDMLELQVAENGIEIELTRPVRTRLCGESTIRLREAIDGLRSLSNASFPSPLPVAKTLEGPRITA